jgi:hypothetical protein
VSGVEHWRIVTKRLRAGVQDEEALTTGADPDPETLARHD